MPLLDRLPEPGHHARREPILPGVSLEPPALVSASLLLLFLLCLPGTVHASQGQQAEPAPAPKQNERPARLPPPADQADSVPAPGANPAEEDSGSHRAGWSKLEPGVLDVQAWDWLQQDLDRMLDQTRKNARNRLSAEAFKAKFIGATAEFLEMNAEATSTFEAAVNKAVTEIDQARTDILRQKSSTEPGPGEKAAMVAPREGWVEYGQAQHRAVRHPLAALQARPRHQLLRESMLKWLLRLDYGMSAAASR